MEDRRGQEVPWPGGSDGPFGIIRRWDLRGEGGGQGLPPPISPGDPQNPVGFTEYWTFSRSIGEGNWVLAGISENPAP